MNVNYKSQGKPKVWVVRTFTTPGAIYRRIMKVVVRVKQWLHLK